MSHTTHQIATRMRELCLAGQYEQAQKEFYHADALSVEPENSSGMSTTTGLDAIIEKGKHWETTVEEIHGGSITEPIVSGNFFT